MKKDKEWFKGLINEEGIVVDTYMLGRIDEQYWENENIKINKGRLFYLIDKLDEPEVLSQEWIDENKSLINGRSTNPDGTEGDCHDAHYIHVLELQNLLVPEQELPVIPKFVADWIEFKKKSRIPYENVLQAIDELINSSTSKAHDWVLKTSENKDAFARAWLDGYEVEEQKYVVKIPTNENNDIPYAIVADSGDIWTDALPSKYKLTEGEIRGLTKGDILFEHFAVKVEELEE